MSGSGPHDLPRPVTAPPGAVTDSSRGHREHTTDTVLTLVRTVTAADAPP